MSAERGDPARRRRRWILTDLVFYDDASGEMRVGSVPTTPAAPEEGVLTATSQLLTGDDSRRPRTSCTGRQSV